MVTIRSEGSQLVTYRKDMTRPQLLGQLGHVQELKYSYALPGGADQLTATLQVSPRYRTDAMDPGRYARVLRGASVVWEGKLQEPAPSPGGWQITATGAGTYGSNFEAVYSGTWGSGTPDDAVNQAIARGMRWVNPGIGSPAGIWLGQATDSASQYITDMLNLICQNGGLTWYVQSRQQGNYLSVFPLPDQLTPTHILVSNSPVPRTIGADYNRVWLRYQSSADGATTATYGVTSAVNQASIDLHDPMEIYADLSSAGTYTAAQAQAVGNNVLAQYIRASFAGTFTVQPGQLLNAGGAPVDLGCQQAGIVCRLALMDYAYGGEVRPTPISFLVGKYEFDDEAQTATITPYQNLKTDFSSFLSSVTQALPKR